MSYGAGGVGLNLQFCGYVFLFDRWWNPAVEDQAINRAHRIGVAGPVTVSRFLMQNTIEQRINQVLEEKRELFDTIFSDAQQHLHLGLTQQELFWAVHAPLAARADQVRRVRPRAGPAVNWAARPNPTASASARSESSLWHLDSPVAREAVADEASPNAPSFPTWPYTDSLFPPKLPDTGEAFQFRRVKSKEIGFCSRFNHQRIGQIDHTSLSRFRDACGLKYRMASAVWHLFGAVESLRESTADGRLSHNIESSPSL